MRENISACPICHGVDFEFSHPGPVSSRVECKNCGSGGPIAMSCDLADCHDKAVHLWNEMWARFRHDSAEGVSYRLSKLEGIIENILVAEDNIGRSLNGINRSVANLGNAIVYAHKLPLDLLVDVDELKCAGQDTDE